MKLDGRVALITGAARRVGRAIALELADAGCDIAIHYLNSEDDARSLAMAIQAKGRRAALIHGDLTDPRDWARIVEAAVVALGRLDVLVNNASAFQTSTPDTIDSFDVNTWDAMLRTNLVACAALIHYASPQLRAAGEGKIINLCDIAAERPWATNVAYCASKAGLVALTKSAARALAPTIQVNGIAPGIAVFPDEYSDEERAKLVNRVPLKREGSPEEIAKLARFLVEDGDYITGQIYAIDGGRSVT